MRAILALCLATTAACGFGDDNGGDDVDPALEIVSVDLPPAETNQTVTLVVRVAGDPDSDVDFTLTSTGGVFAPASGRVTLDATGAGTIASQYTAPATPGNFAHTIDVRDQSGHSAMRPFEAVVDFSEIVVGWGDPLPDSATCSANFLFAQAIDVPADSTLLRLGIIGQAGAQAKLALYRDNGGSPGAKVRHSAPFPLATGRNEVDVQEAELTAGTYWVAVVFDASATVNQDDADLLTIRYASSSFSAQPPTTYPAPANSMQIGALNLYAIVDPN